MLRRRPGRGSAEPPERLVLEPDKESRCKRLMPGWCRAPWGMRMMVPLADVDLVWCFVPVPRTARCAGFGCSGIPSRPA